MRPLKLTLENLRSYRNRQEISFEELGLFAITGSTGAGKSSLLEALVYALYGCATFDKRSVKPLISDGPGDTTMTVSLTFEARGQRWRVDRSCSKSNKSPVHCLRREDGEGAFDGETEVNKQIRELLGLDVDQFLKTVVLPQGKFAQLLDSGPKERREVLESLLGLDDLKRLLETVAERSRQVGEAVLKGQTLRNALPPDPAEAVANARIKLEEARKLEELGTGHLEACRAQQAELESLQTKLGTTEERIRKATALEKDLGGKLQELARLERELAQEAAELKQKNERAREAEKQAEGAREAREKNGRTRAKLSEWLGRARWRDEVKPQLEDGRKQAQERKDELSAAREDLKKLAQEVESLGRQREQLKEQGQAARTAHTQASERKQEAERWLDSWREAGAQLDRLRAKLKQEQDAHYQESEGLESLEQAHQRAQQELSERKAELEKLDQEQRVAAVAGHCRPEDPCPVCARPLPEGFQPPRGEGLEEARKAVATAEKRAQTALKNWQTESGRSAERAKNLAKMEREERELSAAQSERTEKGQKLLGAEIGLFDDMLLEPVRARLEQAEKALETLRERYAEVDNQCGKLESRRSERQKSFEQGEKQLARLEAELEEKARRLAETERELEGHSLESLQKELEQAEAEDRRLQECLAESSRLARAENELHQRSQRELEQPRQGVQKDLHEQRAQLASLGFEVAMPESLSEAARLLEEKRREALVQLEAERQDQASQAARLQSRLTELLAGAESLKALEQRVRQEAEMRARAEQTLEAELARQEKARKLDQALGPAERLKRNLEFLQSTLGNKGRKGQQAFSQWLLERRQQELLELASTRLLEMTGQQYGFSPQFTIVDRHSGQARKPETLSGGETFMASLALALALSELVGRKGGRLEAFFLDEGFGSLSPDCLDRALDALENLAGSGRLIGVISHVSAVAERLERSLQVTRTPQGSQIEEVTQRVPADLREAVLQAF